MIAIPFQNLIGALAWIATRDSEAAEDLSGAWASADSEVDRIVAALYLGQAVSADQLQDAKAQLGAYALDGRIVAVGHTSSNQETRPVPAISWLNAKIDDVESAIGKTGATWLGVHFRKADLAKLWPPEAEGAGARPAKKRTGPHPLNRAKIAGILSQHQIAVKRALGRGETPPARPTAKQIGEQLGIPERTASHNVSQLIGKDIVSGWTEQ